MLYIRYVHVFHCNIIIILMFRDNECFYFPAYPIWHNGMMKSTSCASSSSFSSVSSTWLIMISELIFSCLAKTLSLSQFLEPSRPVFNARLENRTTGKDDLGMYWEFTTICLQDLFCASFYIFVHLNNKLVST